MDASYGYTHNIARARRLLILGEYLGDIGSELSPRLGQSTVDEKQLGSTITSA